MSLFHCRDTNKNSIGTNYTRERAIRRTTTITYEWERKMIHRVLIIVRNIPVRMLSHKPIKLCECQTDVLRKIFF